jgi:hypothetical protein
MIAPEFRISATAQAVEQPAPLNITPIRQEPLESAEPRGMQRDRHAARQSREQANPPSGTGHVTLSLTGCL